MKHITRDNYEECVMDGAVLRNKAASARSIIGSQPPLGYRRYAAALGVLARGASVSDRQAALVDAVLPKLGGAWAWYPKEAAGKMFEAGADALDEAWFDVVLAGSPEPGRRSDQECEYTLGDRLTLIVTLSKAAGEMIPGEDRCGGALARLIEREGARTL